MIPASLYIEKSTDSLATYLGQSVGGLVNATFGNLPELFIGVATLRLGLQDFLKAQIVGGIIVNLLLVLGVAMLLGGLRYHLQAFSTISARSYSSLMLLAIVALLFPSAYVAGSPQFDTHRLVVLSVCVALVLLVTYVLYLFFSLVDSQGRHGHARRGRSCSRRQSSLVTAGCHRCLAGLIALCRVAQRCPGRLGDAGRNRPGSQSGLHGHHSDGHDRQRLGVGHGDQSARGRIGWTWRSACVWARASSRRFSWLRPWCS